MANEQLKQALRNAGLEIDDLASRVGVDVKTARRWLSGRTPYPRYRSRVSAALDVPERTLWPTEVPGLEEADDAGEMIEVLAATDIPDWRELLANARARVELLDLTLAGIITDGDGELLSDAAERGCRVRVLVSDRDSVHLAIAEQDAGREVDLSDRPAATEDLDRVVELLSPHAERGDIELRSFVGAGCYRIMVFDDQAWVRLRLPGLQPEAMPVLHLTRERSDGVFDGFIQHFDAEWQRSEPSH